MYGSISIWCMYNESGTKYFYNQITLAIFQYHFQDLTKIYPVAFSFSLD